MPITEVPPDVRSAISLRLGRDIKELDYRRQMKNLATRYSQTDLARWLGLAQPSISKVLKTAAKDIPVKEGFSGSRPMEICERYAAGLLSREQLIDELTRWEYAPPGQDDGYDWWSVDPPGCWSEVENACHWGLIDCDIYGEVLGRRYPPDPPGC